jgi:Leucine-rich repeat (LRR) protein
MNILMKISEAFANDEFRLLHEKIEDFPGSVCYISETTKLVLINLGISHIPSELGLMKKLRHLDLSSNRIEEITAPVGDCISLMMFDIRKNPIRFIHVEAARVGIKEFFMDPTETEMPPPEVGMRDDSNQVWSFMRGCFNSTEENCFVASNIGITYLPDEIVRNGHKWWMVNLSHNKLETIPSNLVISKMLNTLVISDNPIDTLPEWLNGFKFLRDFRCSGIPFHKFPPVLTQLTTLTRLEMGRCSLNEAPADLVGLAALVDLRLDHNQISVLPGRIGQLIFLTHLLLSSNKLRSLPESIGVLSNLICLAIDDNNFVSIPLQVGRLTSLQMLMIQKNPLRSPPDTVIRQGSQAIIDFCKSIQDSTGFKSINLAKKGLAIVPSEVIELKGISELKLGENSIKDIDADLSCWDGIKSIDLHGNLLQFVPRSFFVLTSLTALMLHGNSIRELPSWLGMLTNLMKLTFDRILISQPCQDIIRQDTVRLIEYLRSLHESKETHNLSIIRLGLSTVPSEILNLTSLTFLNLEANRITALSEKVGSLCHLRILSLRANRLAMVPDSFINLTRLVELDVSQNILHVLQKQIVLLPQISIIDCSHNKLKTIAPTIKYCTTLTRLIIDHNKLWTIPYSEMLFCKNLEYLDLAHNSFTEIDPSIMFFTTINSLMLAGNPLQALPIQFVLLSNITVLDLTGCPLVCPPPSVIAAGKELSREYLNRIVSGMKYGSCDLSELEVQNGETGLQIYRDSIGTLLTELNVTACGFKRLDENFVSIFQVLTDLTLTENALVGLPDNFVNYLSTLQLLRLDGNEIKSISNNDWSLAIDLTVLDLTSNKLHELPDSLGHCLKLLNCFITKNPILQIPHTFSSLQNLEIFECDVDSLTDIQNLSAAIKWQHYGSPPLTVLVRGARALARYYQMVHAASSGIFLDLSGIGMSAIPSTVYSFKWIKQLDLSRNLIKTIPASFKNLAILSELDLRSNPIVYLSPELIGLEHLVNLHISSSCFLSIQNFPIPNFLDSLLGAQYEGQAMNLFIRMMVSSLIQTRSISISGWGLLALNSNWADFVTLTHLDASDNCLGSLPSGLSRLSNLVLLNLKSNFFEVIPDDMSELLALKTALFDLNPIAIISTKCVSNTTLEHLSLQWFEFSPFPPELEFSGDILKFLRAINTENNFILPSCGLSTFNLATMTKSMLLSAMSLVDAPQSSKYTNLALKKWHHARTKISKILGPFQSKIPKPDTIPLVVHSEKIPNLYFDTLRTFFSAYDADEKFLVWARPELFAKIEIDTKPKKWYQLNRASAINTKDQPEVDVEQNLLLQMAPLHVMLNPMCSATNLKELSLHGNSFEFIDNILKEVTSLVDMKITHCGVHALSENLKLLTLLETLNLSHNNMTFLPEQLGRCLILTDLNLSYNQLCRLPISIGRLKHVVNVRLDHNNLSYLTPEIGGVPEVYGMTGWINCKNLNLSHNPLTVLVPTLCGLTSLEVLRIKSCDFLQNPPKEILRGGISHIWKYLQQFRDGLSDAIPSVRISGWGLETIPKCWHIYGDVQALDLADNCISKLDNFQMLSDLTSLKLSGNPIGALEPFIANFSRMKVLLLENINCQVFPVEILSLVELTSLKLDFNPKLDRIPKRVSLFFF